MSKSYVEVNDLDRLLSKIEKKKNQDFDKKKTSGIKKKIEEMALEEIKSTYAGTNVQVLKKEIDDKTTQIVAKSEGIAFDEFGTGFYAQGTYEGELPKQRLVFVSAGRVRTTNGWDYYYDNVRTKFDKDGKPITKNGKFAWRSPSRAGFPNGSLHIGKAASNRFYRSCKKIKERYRLEI